MYTKAFNTMLPDSTYSQTVAPFVTIMLFVVSLMHAVLFYLLLYLYLQYMKLRVINSGYILFTFSMYVINKTDLQYLGLRNMLAKMCINRIYHHYFIGPSSSFQEKVKIYIWIQGIEPDLLNSQKKRKRYVLGMQSASLPSQFIWA